MCQDDYIIYNIEALIIFNVCASIFSILVFRYRVYDPFGANHLVKLSK